MCALIDGSPCASPVKKMDALAWVLVLSHIVFLPALGLAIWKRAWGLAVILAAMIVASTWHHACQDGGVCDDTIWGRADMILVAASGLAALVYAFYRHVGGQVLSLLAAIVVLALGLALPDVSIWWLYGALGLLSAILIIHAILHNDHLDMDWPVFWWAISIFGVGIVVFIIEHATPGGRWLHVVWHVFAGAAIALLIVSRKTFVPRTGQQSSLLIYRDELSYPSSQESLV